MIGGCNFLDVGVAELAVDAVDEGAHFPRVDEEGLLPSVAEGMARRESRPTCAPGFVFREEPEADGNLRAVEELAGKGDHAVHEVGLDDGTADVAFTGLVGGHGSVGRHETRHAIGSQMVDDVLDPAEIGIPLRRQTVAPADVIVLAEPVTDVEGEVGQDVIRLEIRVEILAEGVGRVGAEIAFDATDGEVGQSLKDE